MQQEEDTGMWIGKTITSFVILMAISGCHANSSEPAPHAEARPKYAWWLTTEFDPNNKPDYKDINSYRSIKLFRNSLIEPYDNKHNDFQSSNLSFELSLDLNKDGKAELFRTGIYIDKLGKTGTLILITQDDEILDIISQEGKAAFNALLKSKDELLWFDCMLCDSYQTLKWSQNGYYIW